MTQGNLAVVHADSNGVQMYRQATDAAGLCREIVMKRAINLQGKKYVTVESWQAIATAHGCIASVEKVEKSDDGVVAIASVKRISDGALLATAEGFVGNDEPVWFGGTGGNGKKYPARPMFAIRAMAQTRAISRVCRSAFAHVVVLIDNNLQTTPYEEMVDIDIDHTPARTMPRPAVKSAAPAPKPAPAPAQAKQETPEWPDHYAGAEPEQTELIGAPEPEQEQAADCQVVTGVLKAIAKPRACGKATKHSIKLDNDEWYATFSSTIAEQFAALRGQNVAVYYTTKINGNFTDHIIERIDVVEEAA